MTLLCSSAFWVIAWKAAKSSKWESKDRATISRKAFLVRLVARFPLLSIFFAHKLASSSSLSWAITLLTNPQFRAFSGITFSPTRNISLARAWPIIRGRKKVPPSPGTRPTWEKGSLKKAWSEQTRRSHMQARSQPAPVAGPLITAIITWSQFQISLLSSCRPWR